MRRSSATPINGYEGGPYYLSNLGVKTMRDGTLSFADPMICLIDNLKIMQNL